MSRLMWTQRSVQRLRILRATMSTGPGSKGEVAVVGAGLAGLVCANQLADKGYQVSIFDLGRAYPGGRSATRRTRWEGLQFDHGCQFMKPHRDEVLKLMKEWEDAGVLSKWNARFGTLDASTGRIKYKSSEDAAGAAPGFFEVMADGDVYVPLNSVDSLSSTLIANPRLKHVGLSTQVQRVAQDAGGKWLLEGLVVKQRPSPHDLKDLPSRVPWNLGVFDALVLASTMPLSTGSPASIDFSRAPNVSGAIQQMSTVQAQPLVALMVAFPQAAQSLLPFDAVTIADSPKLSWLCNSSSKPGQQHHSGLQSWVALTTPEFAQELIGTARPLPPQTPEYCTQLAQPVWEALQELLKPVLKDHPMPEPTFLTSHRWGAALPQQPLGIPALVDEKSGLVATGDFCLGAGVDNTIFSAITAAEAVEEQLSR